MAGKKSTKATRAKRRDRLDIECDAINAHARLQALASLMQNSADSDFEFETSHLIALGAMVAEEAARAKTAFYELAGGAHG